MKVVFQDEAGARFRALLESQAGPARFVALDGGDFDLADADILLHVLTPVTRAIIDRAPKLKLIQKIGVGVDAIARDHARARGIAVCNMPGANTPAVAEMTLALMLACLRQLTQVSRETRAGRGWPLAPSLAGAGGEIGGRTIGLLGYGAVPRRLAPILRAMGATCIAFSRAAPDDETEGLPLDEVVARSDILSLHLPSSPRTRSLIDARRIASMKPGAILINTARGDLVDEAALIAALATGRIGAAGLDVFACEPIEPGNGLLGLPNVIATPHVAWLTGETLARSFAVILENCARIGRGDRLLNRVE